MISGVSGRRKAENSVATQPGKLREPGKIREKSGNFSILSKILEKSGNLRVLILEAIFILTLKPNF